MDQTLNSETYADVTLRPTHRSTAENPPMRAALLSIHSTPSRKPTRYRLVGSLVAFLCSVAAPAAGQEEEPAIEDEFSVQRFRPAPGPRNFINTSGARQDGDMAFSAGFMANYAYKPFVVISCASEDECDEGDPGRDDIPVVENLATADIT